MITYVDVPHLGRVRVSQRAGTRSMRISLHQTGEVRLSLPPRVSIQKGIDFLLQKKTWILQHKNETTTLQGGARIGNAHTLRIVPSEKKSFRSYVTENQLITYVPNHLAEDKVQEKIMDAAKKLLQTLAEKNIPARVQHIQKELGYSVRSIEIKALQSRWGSCSSKNDLIFNVYLMQLPWHLIDYVIYHELAHTKHHDHSTAFWQEVASNIPDYKERRRILKKYPTAIFDTSDFAKFVA